MSTFIEAEHPRDRVGKFTDKEHSEPEAALPSADDRNWGEVSIREGARTPWGEAQWVTDIADGIAFVSTAGHGGYKLSPERNREIPTPFRNRNGWYEEDVEQAVVARYHTDPMADASNTLEDIRERAERTLKDYFPDQWEAVNGRELAPGESHVKDERAWAEAHEDDYITTSAQRLPDGRIKVTARRASTGDADTFIVLPGLYDQMKTAAASERGSGHRLVVPAGLKPEPRPTPPPPAPRHRTVPSTEGLTPAARAKVEKDLSQLWRDGAGDIRSLADVIAQDGITEKTVYVEGKRRSYALLVGNASYRVSKATFDAMSAPDRRDPVTKAAQEVSIAQTKLEEARGSYDSKRIASARAEVEAAKEALDRARQEAR